MPNTSFQRAQTARLLLTANGRRNSPPSASGRRASRPSSSARHMLGLRPPRPRVAAGGEFWPLNSDR